MCSPPVHLRMERIINSSYTLSSLLQLCCPPGFGHREHQSAEARSAPLPCWPLFLNLVVGDGAVALDEFCEPTSRTILGNANDWLAQDSDMVKIRSGGLSDEPIPKQRSIPHNTMTHPNDFCRQMPRNRHIKVLDGSQDRCYPNTLEKRFLPVYHPNSDFSSPLKTQACRPHVMVGITGGARPFCIGSLREWRCFTST
jgi:hypothetical protein